MIVGVGKLPMGLLEELRRLVSHPNVFIYPEFFDEKKELIARRYARYIEKLLSERRRVIIALWPDYLYEDRFGLCSYDVIWIFPLHSLKEFDVLRVSCIDVIGFCGDEKLRDYGVAQFVDVVRQLGYEMWFLGANRRQVQIASSLGFWGLDVNTGSTGKPYRFIRSKSFPRFFAEFLIRVAENGFRTKSLV